MLSQETHFVIAFFILLHDSSPGKWHLEKSDGVHAPMVREARSSYQNAVLQTWTILFNAG